MRQRLTRRALLTSKKAYSASPHMIFSLDQVSPRQPFGLLVVPGSHFAPFASSRKIASRHGKHKLVNQRRWWWKIWCSILYSPLSSSPSDVQHVWCVHKKIPASWEWRIAFLKKEWYNSWLPYGVWATKYKRNAFMLKKRNKIIYLGSIYFSVECYCWFYWGCCFKCCFSYSTIDWYSFFNSFSLSYCF